MDKCDVCNKEVYTTIEYYPWDYVCVSCEKELDQQTPHSHHTNNLHENEEKKEENKHAPLQDDDNTEKKKP